MTKRWSAALAVAATASLVVAPATQARSHHTRHAKAAITPLAIEAPDTGAAAAGFGDAPACTTPTIGTPAGRPVQKYAAYHCYRPDQIIGHYGIGDAQKAADYGAGQTIVLVDAYGTPTGEQDLNTFWQAFYGGDADFKPKYTAVYPNGKPDFKSDAPKSQGQSGPTAAEGWAGEATLDIEWAYAIAPKANIVLLGVPPAETEGVQGFPNLFKAMSAAVDKYPSGTVFSQSFGVTEETFGGAAKTQTAKFDAVYKKGIAKGDTFFASSGDDGSFGVSKQHKDTGAYDHPTVGWPASSPYVTAVGGTQVQDGWTWNPTSDVPFTGGPNDTYNKPYWDWLDGGDQDVVWNESWAGIATGGGQSLIYDRPSYQSGVADVTGAHRGVPDISWDAAVNGGVLVYQSFFPGNERTGWHVYGGTSAASPQVAALVSLVNKQRSTPVGQLNDKLYSIDHGAFTDVVKVTEGTAESGHLWDNQIWDPGADGTAVTKDPVPGFPTTTGYDLTTGWGVPNGQAFVDALTTAK